jgi:hypothetical protein
LISIGENKMREEYEQIAVERIEFNRQAINFDED